jgi:hypothetical protein
MWKMHVMHIEHLRHVSYGEDAHGIVGRTQEAPGLGRGLRGQDKALMMAAMPKRHQATLSLILTVSRRLECLRIVSPSARSGANL